MKIEIDNKIYNGISTYCALNEMNTITYINDLLKKAFMIDKYSEKPQIKIKGENDSSETNKEIKKENVLSDKNKENIEIKKSNDQEIKIDQTVNKVKTRKLK